MSAEHIPGRLKHKFNHSSSYLQEHLCHFSASFSRVRWQFPSTRKLHKLFCSCFHLTTTKVWGGSRIRTCIFRPRSLIGMKLSQLRIILFNRFMKRLPIPPYHHVARLSELPTLWTAMLSPSTAAWFCRNPPRLIPFGLIWVSTILSQSTTFFHISVAPITTSNFRKWCVHWYKIVGTQGFEPCSSDFQSDALTVFAKFPFRLIEGRKCELTIIIPSISLFSLISASKIQQFICFSNKIRQKYYFSTLKVSTFQHFIMWSVSRPILNHLPI